MLRENAYEII